MLILITLSIIIMMIVCILMFLASTITKTKTFLDREKNAPFECGFDPKSSARVPFSLHFYFNRYNFFNFWCSNYFNFPTNYNLKNYYN